MTIIGWLLCVVCGALSLWIIALNWGVFWKRHVRGQAASSWVPLFGGILGCAAIMLCPVKLGLIPAVAPFVLDWGSVPGISYSVVWHIARRWRRGEDR